MASIFTFDSEPAKISSPWPTPPKKMANSDPDNGRPLLAGMRMPPAELVVSSGISKLEAEPQEGPTEYKLHLLLRPRRSFTVTSTVQNVSGSHLSKSRAPRSQSETDLKPASTTPVLAPSNQTRQNRLQSLTTQLLWRLQQSSPYHSSSKSSLVLPMLPETDVELSASQGPGPLVPGLEESSGALHEIVSGVTSSLAQELFGYQQAPTSIARTDVVNYASGNVSSWNDMHSEIDRGRLVFVTDSAGHPRYRRTTLRGLVSWAPHWTLCCVAADDEDDSSGKIGATATSSEILGSAGEGVDLSKAHLELCLKLDLPLVIVITKLDIATKSGLRNTLTKVLNVLKSAGRKPAMLSTSSDERGENQLQTISTGDAEAAQRAIAFVQPDEVRIRVPIVLTSSVTGSGIGTLHALLRQLPLTFNQAQDTTILYHPDDKPMLQSLFHVDEVFAMPSTPRRVDGEAASAGTILSGYLRYGELEIGEMVLIGPCTPDTSHEARNSPEMHRASSFPGLIKGSPRAVTLSHDRRRPSSSNLAEANNDARVALHQGHIWQEVRITSLRNLRLPVRQLLAGQVGTVGIAFKSAAAFETGGNLSSSLEVRRGTVMLPALRDSTVRLPPAYTRFTAVFNQASLPAWPGVIVIVYIASIRASARIVEVRALECETTTEDVFKFDDSTSNESDSATLGISESRDQTEIIFEFANSQEWIELGTPVLVTPGGGPSLTGQPEQREVGSAGLDGYIGTITYATV
ncbi:hypothetical protein P7C71_g5557, partial [Lecanoromycetidae sp. Uapishka_2]